MEHRQSDILLIMAMILSLVSIPMVWVAVPLIEVFSALFLQDQNFSNGPGIYVNVTGFDGRFDFLLGAPFWLLSLLVVVGSLLLMLSTRKIIQISRTAEWGVAIVPAILLSLGLVVTLMTTSASLGFGIFLAVASAYIPVYYLWEKSSALPASTRVEEKPLAS